MGFCRRCGDIVVGPRCRCGGTAVAAAVKWNGGDDEGKQDWWTKTYVTKSAKSEPARPTIEPPSETLGGGPSSSPTKRFPRPSSSTTLARPPLSTRVSDHIASATSARPTPKTRASIDASTITDSHAEHGILPSPHGSELAKVYGSVLQPKETLASFRCGICSTIFPPDATIYPDPSSVNSAEADGMPTSTGPRFLCRPCFIENGGSKGKCATCHRPVLILKSEGGFVETSGQVWHRKCFNCEGCERNLGDEPMVDLLGRPCCSECFDTCLKRPPKGTDSPGRFAMPERAKPGNLGGRRVERSLSQETDGSPALEELQARLGISRTKEGTSTPARVGKLNLEERMSPFIASTKDINNRFPTVRSPPSNPRELDNRTYSAETAFPERVRKESDAGSDFGDRQSPRRHARTSLSDVDPALRTRARRSRSRARESIDPLESTPTGQSTASTPRRPTEDAIEEMKKRFLSGSPSVTPTKPSASSSSTARRRSRSRSRPRASLGDTDSVDSPSLRSRALKKATSTSSLRSRLASQRTGETELLSETDLGTESDHAGFALVADRTGESTLPLRIHPNRTGDSAVTHIARDLTGATTTGFTSVAEQTDGFSTDYDSCDRFATIRPQKTGDRAMGYGFSGSIAAIVEPLRVQKTGDRANSSLSSQRTGDRTMRSQFAEDNDISRQSMGNRASEAATIRSPRSSLASSDGDAVRRTVHPSFTTSSSASSVSSRADSDSVASVTLGMRGLGLSHQSGSFSTSSVASSGYESSVSSTPDLMSDFSDTTSSRSSLPPSTPPPTSPRTFDGTVKGPSASSSTRNITPTRGKRAQTFSALMGLSIPEQIPPDARCEKCRQPLFSTQFGGKFVTVPEEPSSTGALPRRYHTACFTCRICGEVFEEKEGGHAVFVRVEEGACHVHCAPPEKISLRKTHKGGIFQPSKIPIASTLESTTPKQDTQTAYYTSSSRYERPPPTAPPTQTSFSVPQPRFGGSITCPGCHKAVSPMERGVVPGPQGSKWHAGCLICGGLEAKGRRKEPGKAGCGKKLDSAAKTDAEGGVWCRECLLLLPPALRQPAVRSPTVSMTGGSTAPFTRVQTQGTGTTTIARQFTGIGTVSSGSADAALLRQLTGGASSPTRQLTSSPTKQHDGPRPGHRYPRPKSVTGTRSEGRGMFLVRQLTGGSGSFSGNDYGS